MSDLISMSSSEILSTASQFATKSGDLNDIMQQIKSQIATMQSWKGDANVNFNDAMTEWNATITQVDAALDDITRKLHQYENDMHIIDTSTVFQH